MPRLAPVTRATESLICISFLRGCGFVEGDRTEPETKDEWPGRSISYPFVSTWRRAVVRGDNVPVMDVLADVLSAARVGGVVTAHVRAEAPWGFRLQQTPFAAFHAVASGTCWLRLPRTAPRQLLPGDV